MSLFFQTNSLLTTIQDWGRQGFRAFGVNPNGVMDRAAARLTNILLGNDEREAVLEIHFPAPRILFEADALVALGGADFGARLDGVRVENWQIVPVRKGQILGFAGKASGNRLYLSVAGGFAVADWLGSKSTNLKAKCGGFAGRKLQENDRLAFKNPGQELTGTRFPKISPYFVPNYTKISKIRVIEGAEFGLLTPLSSETLIRESFRIALNSDRMGFRLLGEPLYLLNEREMVSSAVTFGTLQLLPNGQIIILMADHQTTGGYPRIGNVVAVDLPRLAQLGVNDSMTFEMISLAEAEVLALEFERNLNLLKYGVRFQKGL